MKTFGEFICLFGILIFKLMLCSAADELSEADLKKIYKLSSKGDNIHTKEYEITEGETTGKPIKKIWMLMANPKVSSYIPQAIAVLKDLKKGKKDLLRECVADMLNHGTYDKKKVLIVPGLGKNLKEYTSKACSWSELTKIGPCMIKALRLLHDRSYVHQNLKPESFAFGTEEKAAPLKSQVYLFDFGVAEKYKHSNGTHKSSKEIAEFDGEMAFASRAAMNKKSQSPRDDIESLFCVLAHLAGLKIEKTDFQDSYNEKQKFCSLLDAKEESAKHMKSVYEKSKIKDLRVFNSLLEFSNYLSGLFDEEKFGREGIQYDDFISCFDQGLSEEGIKKNYEFVSLNKFENKGAYSLIGTGSTTTDPDNKKEVVMKLMKDNMPPLKELKNSVNFKREIRVYKDLKKGLNHSLLRENICDMLDYGVYDNRRAIIMPRLGEDLYDVSTGQYDNGYPYDLVCLVARQAINALRFLHKKGYVNQDVKPENFVFGRVEVNKTNKSQLDIPLKNRLFLIDFGFATKWKYANGTHIPRVRIATIIGTVPYINRAAITQYTQSRRDDMESLMFGLAFIAAKYPPLIADLNIREIMYNQRDDFITQPGAIARIFRPFDVDKRLIESLDNYAAQLNKLFASDEPEHFEMEPDYNAFCVCFGGKGSNPCVVS